MIMYEALAEALQIPDATGTEKQAAAASMCTYYKNKDVITSTRFETMTGGVDKINSKLWKDWFGKEIAGVTPRMVAADYAAFHFYEAEVVKAKYDYRMWINYTALGGSEFQGGWANYLFESPGRASAAEKQQVMALAGAMNNAILKSHGATIDIQTDSKSMPIFFNENMILIFGGFSLPDFIVRGLMPYILLLYLFVIQGLIVFEKEAHLRDMMVMSGLKMSVYWFVQFIFYFIQYMVMIAILWFAGIAVGLKTFTMHDPGLLLLFFVVWGILLILFSFLCTTFFSSPRTATAVCFLGMEIAVECGLQLIDILVNQPGSTEAQYLPYMWFPPMVMIRGMLWLATAAVFNTKITFQNWTKVGDGVLPKVFLWMLGEIIMCIILLPIFESYCPTGGGTSRRRIGRGKGPEALADLEDKNEPADVREERNRTEKGDSNGDQMVRTLNLRKTFNGGKKVAVKNLSFSVNKSECFGLLGHNGAGKSTTINMLCGLFGPTSGNAIVNGHRLSDSMGEIHKVMGVCPQDNVLWNDLTAAEHLKFYARLRGVKPKDLKRAVGTALASVNLHKWANVASGKFSGGMKRRLSVAIAIVGNPRIVYLDEPSTGLDPASRRKLWGVISSAKANKAVLLTTHSMEEAEVLCDRIGIMSEGVMKCLDIPAKLKQRYGDGYKLSIHTKDRSNEMAQRVVAFVSRVCPDATLLNEPMGGTSDYELPKGSIKISDIYLEVDKMIDTLGILDWGITETTMEEVFLKVSNMDDPRKTAKGGKVSAP
jgi:ABC-type multidrug transport system ATPase subunit